jgi:hypothetical protein
MTFLVRKLRTLPDLRRFKVVVTDRTDLEEQLSASAVLSGEQPRKSGCSTATFRPDVPGSGGDQGQVRQPLQATGG